MRLSNKPKLLSSKKGQVQGDIVVGITAFITVIIGLIIVLQVFGGTAGDVVTAFDNASSSGLPLAGLMSSSGVIALAYSAGVILGLIGLALGVASVMRFAKK